MSEVKFEIELSKPSHIPALKTMWSVCFPADSRRFVDYYFDNIFKPDDSLTLVVGTEPAAFLQIIPHRVNYTCEIPKVAYLSGVMTAPQFQGRGLASELLRVAFELICERGFAFSFLIPQSEQLKRFYSRLGYTACGQTKIAKIDCADNLNITELTENEIFNAYNIKIFNASDALMRLIPGAVLKTEEQFVHILWDFFSNRGVVFAQNRSVAFAKREQGFIRIVDLLAPDENSSRAIQESVCRYFNVETVKVEHSPFQSISGIEGMWKPACRECNIDEGLYISMMLSE